MWKIRVFSRSPLFWSVIGERTGLKPEKEKPLGLAHRTASLQRLLAYAEICHYKVRACEQAKNARFQK